MDNVECRVHHVTNVGSDGSDSLKKHVKIIQEQVSSLSIPIMVSPHDSTVAFNLEFLKSINLQMLIPSLVPSFHTCYSLLPLPYA